MDVTCDRCRTEYVFDDNLVSQRGTTVKCTQCGHLFKVFREGASPPADARRQDSPVESSQGHDVRVGAAFATPPVAPVAPPPPRTPSPPPARSRPITLSGVGSQPIPLTSLTTTELAGEETIARPQPAPPATVPKPDASASTPPPPIRIPRLDPLPKLGVSDRPSRARATVDEDEIEVPGLPRRRGRVLGIVLALGLVGAAGYAGIHRDAILARVRGASDVEASLREGRRLLATDTSDGYRLAADSFVAVHRKSPSSLEPVVALSRAHAYWGQLLAFDADDEAAHAAVTPERRERAERLRSLANEHAEEALRYARHAVTLGEREPLAHLALADAERLRGRTAEARTELARAQGVAGPATSDPFYVTALLGAADHAGDLAFARVDAERAVAIEPTSIRARLLLARAKIATGDTAGARTDVDSVLARAADHASARVLLARLDALETASPVVDAGVLDAATSDASALDASQRDAALEDASATAVGSIAATRADASVAAPREPAAPSGDYSVLVRRAEDFANRGDLARARATFEAALAARPSSPEAQSGLGEVLLRSGFLSQALPHLNASCDSGYAHACFELGDAYRTSGREREALGAYRRYLERYPNGPNAALATRYADELGSAATP